MSGAYIVIGANQLGEIKFCEAFAGRQSADVRARELIGQTNTHQYPTIKVEQDNSIEWTYYKGALGSVTVHWKSIQIDSVAAAPNFWQNLQTSHPSVPVPVPVPSPTPAAGVIAPTLFDGAETIPGGFNSDNKPVFLDYVMDFPDDVKPTSDLSESQRWALVTAYTKKHPRFTVYIPGAGTFIQSSALPELKGKTDLGRQIVSTICNQLDDFRLSVRNIDQDFDCFIYS